MESLTYPGNANHQALLQALIDYYRDDPRIRAIILFGSLARGNWDQYSDLDLNIIITDDLQLNPIQEIQALCASFDGLGQEHLLIVPDDDDAGDVVLGSTLEFSVRYHPLRTTSPNIVDDMLVLAGPLDTATIRAAGLANRTATDSPLSELLDACVRYALGVSRCLRREQLWGAVDQLYHMRHLLMTLYTRTHGGIRSYQFFQAEAKPYFQRQLGTALPQADLTSVQAALDSLINLLDKDLSAWTNGQLELQTTQRFILDQIRNS